jgi:hypothetical protein
MTARRPIEISAPRGADADPIPLRLFERAGHPPMLVPPLEWCLDLFWLHGIVVESPAPMPPRIFEGMPRIFVESTALGRS